MSTVLVCGGRDYRGAVTMRDVMDALHAKHGFTLVIHGAASGADSLAGMWAKDRGVAVREYPANWANGRGAGPIRNERMLREGRPDLVVAFPGGRGTAHMVGIARRAGVTVLEVQR